MTVLEEIEEVQSSIDRIDDPTLLDKIRDKIADLLDRLDDRLDVRFVEERRDEPTISHSQLTQELRRDGLI